MTSTLDAPAPAHRVAPRPADDGPPVRDLWRRALTRAVLVPLPVLAPLVALAQTADHRYNVFWHGALFRDNPLRIVPDTVRSIPGFLRAGNFRLFGRMLEKSLDLAAYTLGDLGLPANVAFRLVEFVVAVLLCLVAVLFTESLVARGPMFRRAPSTLAAAVPFAVAAGFVAAGGSGPVVLFGGLYFGSAALVLAVPTLLCRIGVDRRIRLWWAVPLLLAGAVLAAFNEIVYLALPLATVTLAARARLVWDLSWRRALTAAPTRALGLLWLGFLPVFVGVRVVIYRYCAAGPCYRGSDVQLGPDALAALPARLTAWLPPLMWDVATRGANHRPWLGGVVLFGALLVLLLLAGHALRDLPRLSRVGRRAAAVPVLAAGTLVLLGAAMGSLAIDIQQQAALGNGGLGWRDSAVTTTAGAVLLVALAHLATRRRIVVVALIVLLAAGAAVSAAANKRYRDNRMATEPARLANQLAEEMVDFDRTPAGAARRCALRAEFFAMYHDAPFSLRRFDTSFELAARQRTGQPFCPGVTAPR